MIYEWVLCDCCREDSGSLQGATSAHTSTVHETHTECSIKCLTGQPVGGSAIAHGISEKVSCWRVQLKCRWRNGLCRESSSDGGSDATEVECSLEVGCAGDLASGRWLEMEVGAQVPMLLLVIIWLL
ncbi:hypothetical protein MKX03_007983 [Papaver bracteatum]|nr:hypothetical protein MKX03_007983 [Papaver bracteatum]